MNSYARAAFWFYPTSVAETSCMSGMRAMANGAVPVTSALPHSGLTETVQGFDMGRGGDVLFNAQGGEEGLKLWAAAAVDALKWSQSSSSGSSSSSSSIGSFRARMVEAASERFLDDAVVAK